MSKEIKDGYSELQKQFVSDLNRIIEKYLEKLPTDVSYSEDIVIEFIVEGLNDVLKNGNYPAEVNFFDGAED